MQKESYPFSMRNLNELVQKNLVVAVYQDVALFRNTFSI